MNSTPQAVALLLAIASSIAMAGRVLFGATAPTATVRAPSAATATTAVVPPTVVTPVVPSPAAPVVPLALPPTGPILPVSSNEMKDDEDGDDDDCVMDADNNDEDNELEVDDNKDNAPPPPPSMVPPVGPLLLPALMIVAVLASFASALGQFDVFVAIMNAVPLDHSPLVPVASGVVQHGCHGIPHCKTEGLTDVQLITEMHRIWTGARCVGECELSKITFTTAGAINNVVNHAARVMKVLHPGVQLWPGCDDINALFPDNRVLSLVHDIPHQNALPGIKTLDVFLDIGGVLSDAAWVSQMFLIVITLCPPLWWYACAGKVHGCRCYS